MRGVWGGECVRGGVCGREGRVRLTSSFLEFVCVCVMCESGGFFLLVLMRSSLFLNLGCRDRLMAE